MNRWTLYWLALVLVTVARTLALFPTAASAFSDEPLMNADYPLHAYHAHLGSARYDPHFLAGYPKTPHFDASVAPFEWASRVVPGLFRSGKVLVVATPLVMLALVVVGLAGLGLSPAAVRIGAGLAVVEFWISLPVVFLLLAMVSNLLGIGCAVAALGLLVRARTAGGVALFWAAALSAVLTHPHALLVVVLGTLALTLFMHDRPRWLRFAALAGCGAAAMVYVVPYLAFRRVMDPTARSVYWALARPAEPLHYYFALDDGARQAGVFELALLALAVVELVRWHRAGRTEARGLGALLAGLFAFTFYGSLTTAGASVQPLRLAVAIAYLAIPPAAAALADLARSRWRPALGAGVAVLGALLVQGQFSLAGTLIVGLSADDRALIDRVAHAPPGRVLIEDGSVGGPLGGGEASGGGVLALIPYFAKREIIGGPVAWVYIKHRFANAVDGVLFGREAGAHADLRPLLDRYAIGSCLVWSAGAYAALAKTPGLTPAGRVGRLLAFHRAPPSAVLEGQGRVTAALDALRIEGASGNRLVLSYHHDPLLAVDPPARLVPVPLGDDPVPFLGVESPPPAFVIGCAGRSLENKR